MHKVTFWILSYLPHHADLLEVIRAETTPGVRNGVPDATWLNKNCPRLEGLFLETVRMYTSTSLMRSVTAENSIGKVVLRKGRNVMIPYRQFHFNEEVWGSDVSTFDPERFLKDKTLAKNPNFKPFGGGEHLCPGRFLARHLVFSFVALTLHRFDVCLSGRDCRKDSLTFPKPDESKPGLGTLAPAAGHTVFVDISPRKESH